jgi:hypothetical protein
MSGMSLAKHANNCKQYIDIMALPICKIVMDLWGRTMCVLCYLLSLFSFHNFKPSGYTQCLGQAGDKRVHSLSGEVDEPSVPSSFLKRTVLPQSNLLAQSCILAWAII